MSYNKLNVSAYAKADQQSEPTYAELHNQNCLMSMEIDQLQAKLEIEQKRNEHMQTFKDAYALEKKAYDCMNQIAAAAIEDNTKLKELLKLADHFIGNVGQDWTAWNEKRKEVKF